MKPNWTKLAALFSGVLLAGGAIGIAGVAVLGTSSRVAAGGCPKGSAETVYVTNRSNAISDATIKKDIPSWEAAANGAFAKAWETPKVCIRFAKKVPFGAVGAVFQNKGAIKGALAYHTSLHLAPYIVVYAGVGKFYGYNNSVSFTHELFELLADPTISRLQQGWWDPLVYLGKNPELLPVQVDWIAETADPVEAYAYSVKGVQISDWITPAWFNAFAPVTGRYVYDRMNEIQQPLTIAPGGYAQFYYAGQWYALTNFTRKSDRGFFLGEQDGRKFRVLVHR